ncbi:MAG: hypothetical protein ABIF04_04000 [Chloroflexota bacterium]
MNKKVFPEEEGMHRRKLSYLFISAGFILVFTVGVLFLIPPRSVSAQCGSQTSSCKNCHEVQGQDPVNSDGTDWHESHAFGDFCYLCHAGNNQATDKLAAHTGMVAPLSDLAASCLSCHPNDYSEKAQLYATSLGIVLGSGGDASVPTQSQVAPTEASATPVAATKVSPSSTAIIASGDMVDYTQRYDELVLGKKPANVGNIIAMVLIALLLLGGGFFVLRKEGWVHISFQETKQIKGRYPADVVDMVPAIARLKPTARQILRRILGKPQVASELFASIEKLSKNEHSSDDKE